MPKLAKPLTAVEVRRLIDPGRHAVGTISGLHLYVKDTGARSWVLRKMVGGRRAEQGLGAFPETTLAQAIDRARQAIDQIRSGIDPAAERRAQRTAVERTFQRTAEQYITAHRAGWKNAKHADQWANTLATYVYPIFGAKHVRDVTKADLLAVLEQPADAAQPDAATLWVAKNETANRVRNRIELVLNYAVQREYRPEGLNPARWRGNLDGVLPKSSKVAKVEHHAALPIDEVHGFMQRLRAMDGMGARALEFGILTAARSGEVRGATWHEIDLQAAVWTIPAARMKSGREHRVPLSEPALQLLEDLPRFEGVPYVFPGAGNKPLSDMTLTAALRRMKVEATAHGFRSTFRDWAAERTSTPAEVAEMALAHAVGDATEAAYRRGDLFDKRAELMGQWAKFIDTPPPKGNVRALRTAKGAP